MKMKGYIITQESVSEIVGNEIIKIGKKWYVVDDAEKEFLNDQVAELYDDSFQFPVPVKHTIFHLYICEINFNTLIETSEMEFDVLATKKKTFKASNPLIFSLKVPGHHCFGVQDFLGDIDEYAIPLNK